MGKHVLASAGALAAVIAIGALASTPVAGQATTGRTAASAGKTARWTPPKTPWGDPDLQGNLTNIYEVNTPFERPDEFQGGSWRRSRAKNWPPSGGGNKARRREAATVRARCAGGHARDSG